MAAVVAGVLLILVLASPPMQSSSVPTVTYGPSVSCPQCPMLDTASYLQQINDLRGQLTQARADVDYYKNLNEQQVGQNYMTQRYITHYIEGTHENSYDLIVTVKNEDGDRLADAYVRVENSDSTSKHTDDDGEARFNSLEEDCYDVRASKSGYNSESDSVCLEDDERLTVRLAEE